MIEKWLCTACKFILGFVEDKRIVRIKRKDLYVETEGGKVSEICPRCGKQNTLIDNCEKTTELRETKST